MDLPVRAQMLRLAGGYMVTQSLATAVRLGLPRLVTERPRPVDELAETVGADPDALRRLLRALASNGVFTEREGRIEHTDLSRVLDESSPDSMAAQVTMFGSQAYRVWSEAFDAFRTGGPVAVRVLGSSLFDWFPDHPEQAATFNQAMADGARQRVRALLDLDWSGASTVVDVGGGTGGLLTAVLAGHPHLSGTVLDLPHVREEAERAIAAAGLADRCAFVVGSFFEQVPAGADVYVLSVVLHDWDDERAAQILRRCREAARPDSRLLLVESVIGPGEEWEWAKWLDLHMLVMLGGRERSEVQWRDLLEGTGFTLERARPGLVEARPSG
jgi:SAM-dependent methyltransferase